MKRRAHIYIQGLVQGVFFRAHVRSHAVSHGIKGWVRNLRDGRVEALLEGEEEGLEKVIEACKRGPRGARVTGIDVRFEEYKGEFDRFEIRYF
jgi:acylphosphatase